MEALPAREDSGGGPGPAVDLPLPCRVPEMVAVARPAIPEALVGEDAWSRLSAIDDPLPPLGREAALECRLEPGPGTVDFELCLRSACRPRLVEVLDSGALDRHVSPRWRSVGRLLRSWCDPTTRVHHGVRAIWLEFDVPEGGAAPAPFGVVTLDPGPLYATGVADRPALAALLRSALDPLAGGLKRAAAESLDRTVAGLPDFAQVLHAAVRPTSEGSLMRLVVALPWRHVPDTLARLGWPGPTDRLAEDLAELCRSTLVHSINLDLLPEVGPRIGVEFHHPTAPARDERWRHLLDRLEAHGALCPHKRRALEAWGDWRDAPREPGLRLERDLLVKVVLEGGADMRAKAYLPFSPVLTLHPEA
jgi:hypothetical protein